MVLLVAGTAGLFFLIKPALQSHESGSRTVAIVPNSVAVMPFESSGMDPNDSWLSEGLSDELRDQLGRVQGLRIAARSSSITARDQGLDALEVSSKLGVANLVEGSLRRQGRRNSRAWSRHTTGMKMPRSKWQRSAQQPGKRKSS
jgi:TolB-like protein